jgi:integrase
MTDVTIGHVIRRHTDTPATTHGFRSTFRDWVGDCTEFPEVLAEAAIAHAIGDETETAYRRGDALVKRRALMQAWADYLHSAM